jgi:hypothetical protein
MAQMIFAIAVLLLPFAAQAHYTSNERPTLTSVKQEVYAFVECVGKRYEATSAFTRDAAAVVSQAFTFCRDEERQLRAAAETKFGPKAAAGIVASVRARARVTVIELVAEAKLRSARRYEAGVVESGDR